MRGNQVAISIGLGLMALSVLTEALNILWALFIIGAACVIAGLLNRPLQK